jgi:hypothetical protein
MIFVTSISVFQIGSNNSQIAMAQQQPQSQINQTPSILETFFLTNLPMPQIMGSKSLNGNAAF